MRGPSSVLSILIEGLLSVLVEQSSGLILTGVEGMPRIGSPLPSISAVLVVRSGLDAIEPDSDGGGDGGGDCGGDGGLII